MSSSFRHSFSSGNVNALRFTKDVELIKELIDKDFFLYISTKLTLVRLDEDVLNQLEESLKTYSSGCVEACISVINNGKFMPPSLKIFLKFKKGENFTCIFASTSSNKLEGNDINLPLLCVTSGHSLIKHMTHVLESVLGCLILPYKTDHTKIKWLYGIALNEIIKRNKETEFSIGYQVEPDMNFSCNLPFGELHYLWRTCKKTDETSLHLEELEYFHRTFTNHFEKAFKVKVSMFPIVSMNLKYFSLDAENKVKMSSSLHPLMYSIFSFIESDIPILS